MLDPNVRDSIRASHLEAAKSVESIRSQVATLRGARDHLVKVRDLEIEEHALAQEEARLNDKARLFLLSEISEKRTTAVRNIEIMGSNALCMVYGDNHFLKFVTLEDKRRADGLSDFSMRIMLEAPYKGEQRTTGLVGSVGGGVVETAAYALRFAVINLKNYEGPIIFDEAFKSMSDDEKIYHIAKLIRKICDVTRRQVIIATHKLDVFGAYADNIIKVEKVDGVAKVSYLDPKNIKTKTLDDFDEFEGGGFSPDDGDEDY